MIRLGTLDANIVEAPGSVSRGGTVVVLFHGYGAPGDDLVPIARAFDRGPSTRYVFPAAPIALQAGYDFSAFGMGAPRAWWPIDLEALEAALASGSQRDLAGEVPEGLREAREQACTALGAIEKAMAPERLVIGGFSQGAMLATSIALETDQRLDGLIAWSGTYLSSAVWKPRMPTRAGLRAVVTHGTHDPLLPHSLAERLAADMKDAGLLVDFVSFRGQHQIPPIALQRAEALLSAL